MATANRGPILLLAALALGAATYKIDARWFVNRVFADADITVVPCPREIVESDAAKGMNLLCGKTLAPKTFRVMLPIHERQHNAVRATPWTCEDPICTLRYENPRLDLLMDDTGFIVATWPK